MADSRPPLDRQAVDDRNTREDVGERPDRVVGHPPDRADRQHLFMLADSGPLLPPQELAAATGLDFGGQPARICGPQLSNPLAAQHHLPGSYHTSRWAGQWPLADGKHMSVESAPPPSSEDNDGEA